jgi:uncharacterized membrane protein YjgN (DUF898 family)
MPPHSLADDLEDSALREELYGPRRVQSQSVESPPAFVYRMTFSGDGREYFRIWIVNLTLTLVTLGIYSAYAKVRKTRYYWQNTRLEGMAFDYHGDPLAILRGRILAVALLVIYSFGTSFSATVGLASVTVLIAVAPWLFLRSQQFKLRNTSHRGLRFGFAGTARQAYARFLPLLLVWFAPTLLTLAADEVFAAAALAGFASAVLFPLMHHELKCFQHRHATYGDRPFRFTAARGAFYLAYLMGSAIVIPVAMGMGAAVGVFVAATQSEGPPNTTYFFVLGAAFGVLAYLCVAPFLAARLQKVVWERTSLPGVRFRTEISAATLYALVFKNVGRTLLTLGLYWPFAAIAIARYRVQAFSAVSEVPIDSIAASTQAAARAAAGEGAADLFGLDIGL